MSSLFTPPEADQEIAPPSTFELLWLNHRGAFLGSVAGIIALLVIVLGVLATSHSSRIASETLLSTATSDVALNEVISKYPRTAASADATLTGMSANMDTVSIYWNHSTPTVEISDLSIIRFY